MEKEFNKEDLIKSIKRLKSSTFIFIISFTLLWGVIVLANYFLKNNLGFLITSFIVLGIVAVVNLIFFLTIIFRIRFVLQRIEKGKNAFLWQLGVLFIPFGVFFLPFMVLDKAKDYLRLKEKQIVL
ncbi:MAG: hypothetical protein KJ893_06625 [Candidatus Omnitrophica bacterium]|nr:hypothetical protein [Candidatus Omnitrophota bacterium]MBU4479454.1 hypothetical protein [Candidatus Omnitrophota bacterium]